MSTPDQSDSTAPPKADFKRHVPNLLVVARLIMAGAMIAVLSIYRFPDTNGWALPIATALFIIAALTDALDGYLARKWDAISVFGRIMDPTADKILVLGAFVMLAGPGFYIPDLERYGSLRGTQASGVLPWMAIVILSRELLVTAMRGALESHGVAFSASLSGKLKMIFQSVGAPILLLLTHNPVANFVVSGDEQWRLHEAGTAPIEESLTDFRAAAAFQNASFGIALLITFVTALSAIPYIIRARAAFKGAQS